MLRCRGLTHHYLPRTNLGEGVSPPPPPPAPCSLLLTSQLIRRRSSCETDAQKCRKGESRSVPSPHLLNIVSEALLPHHHHPYLEVKTPSCCSFSCALNNHVSCRHRHHPSSEKTTEDETKNTVRECYNPPPPPHSKKEEWSILLAPTTTTPPLRGAARYAAAAQGGGGCCAPVAPDKNTANQRLFGHLFVVFVQLACKRLIDPFLYFCFIRGAIMGYTEQDLAGSFFAFYAEVKVK